MAVSKRPTSSANPPVGGGARKPLATNDGLPKVRAGMGDVGAAVVEAFSDEDLRRATGLEVRICEEITQRHIFQTLAAWSSFVEELKRDRPARAFAAEIVNEAERCLRRIELLRAGRLRLLRWHAIRRWRLRG